MKVGIIKELWRYPVKGMAGESLNQCAIGPLGLAGDRTWALRDTARAEIQSCKFRPELLTCSAHSRPEESDGHVDVVFPNGDSWGSDDASIHRRLSEMVGHDSTLEPLRPIAELDFYRRHKRDDHTWLEELKATFAREAGEPLPDFSKFSQQARDFVTLPGTYFLVAPFHIVTTATMQYMRTLLPEADWNMRRFRPNIVVDTGADQNGLVEQAWVNKRLTIGELHMECTDTAPRCGAVTRAQSGLEFDASMLRTIVQKANQNLGVYGTMQGEGMLSVGDAVYVT